MKSLKVFFGDYLNRNDLVASFKSPARYPNIIEVPTRAELRKFYNALKTDRARAYFLIYASSGLRRREVKKLNKADVNLEKRMILPNTRNSRTKHHLTSFYNDEAERALSRYLASRNDSSPRLLPIGHRNFRRIWKQAYEETGIKITPQTLRQWFASELGQLGVQDRYVDAFCGRVPKSILAKHYTDYASERLKAIYDKAGLKVLS